MAANRKVTGKVHAVDSRQQENYIKHEQGVPASSSIGVDLTLIKTGRKIDP